MCDYMNIGIYIRTITMSCCTYVRAMHTSWVSPNERVNPNTFLEKLIEKTCMTGHLTVIPTATSLVLVLWKKSLETIHELTAQQCYQWLAINVSICYLA